MSLPKITPRRRLFAMIAAAGIIIGYLAFRLFVHSSALLEPAVITPAMDAHHALAPTLDARIYRLTHDQRPATPKPGVPHGRLIALTFDDGPYAVTTPLLLDILSDRHVPATFFLIGRDAELQPELTQRIVAGGFEVANHTYTHPRLDRASVKRIDEELINGRNALRAFTNAKSVLTEWRPPHGRFSELTVTAAQKLGYTTVLWNDDPGDYRLGITTPMLLTHIEEHASSPEILLLHSGVLATIQMLPQAIDEFRARGYTFVTVSELFAHSSLEMINHPERVTLATMRKGH
jgi:peptidoglycan/xylan/chitin deacetylase (PgdA/CDA1 family)